MEQREPESWFCDAVLRLKKTAFSVSYAILNNAGDCEEATASAILRAYEKRGQLRARESFPAWFLRILKNECFAILKRRARVLPLSEDMPAPETDGLPVRDPDLQRALRELPPEQRAALVLQYVEGYGIDEIASILDIPSGTVKSRVFRAKAALRQTLREEAIL